MDWLEVIGAEGFSRLCDFALGRIKTFIDKETLKTRICKQLEVEKKKHKTAIGDQSFAFSFDSFSRTIVKCFSDAKTLELLINVSKDQREEATRLIICKCIDNAQPESFDAKRYIENAVYDFCRLLYKYYYSKTPYDQRVRDMRIVDSINIHTDAEIDSLKKIFLMQQNEHGNTFAISDTYCASCQKEYQYSSNHKSEQEKERLVTEHDEHKKKRETIVALFAMGSILTIFILWYSVRNNGEITSTTPNSDTITSSVDTSSSISTLDTSYAPVEKSLLSLTPWTKMPFVEANYSMEDIFGTQYDNCIYCRTEKSDGNGYCTYRLNYEYTNFQFISGIVSYGRGDPGTATIRVLGDGEELYSRELTCESDSIEVKLKVSDVKDLTIELYGVSEPEVSLRGSTSLYPALFNPTLKPAYNVIDTFTPSTINEISEQAKWVYLTDCTPYSGLPFSKSGNTSDIFGNEYGCSLRGYQDEASAIWRLNYEYNTLVFTLGVPSMCRGSNPDWYSGSIKIYCDDVIVYEKSCIDSLTESEVVTVDVSNTNNLKIQISAVYHYLEPAVFDPVLYKY